MGVHNTLNMHPLWTLGLKHAGSTWYFADLINLSLQFEKDAVLCRLCERSTYDIVTHFLIECPVMYQERDKLFEVVVNNLDVSNYVKFSHLEDHLMCETLLGSRVHVDISDSEWENMMVCSAKTISMICKTVLAKHKS